MAVRGMTTGWLIACVLLFSSAPHVHAEDTFAGSMAADWQLKGLDGRSYEMAKLKGKAVLLNFWATWCAPCRIETKWLVELHRQYHARGLQIVGISMDEASDDAEVARFAARYEIPYPILLRGQAIADHTAASAICRRCSSSTARGASCKTLAEFTTVRSWKRNPAAAEDT